MKSFEMFLSLLCCHLVDKTSLGCASSSHALAMQLTQLFLMQLMVGLDVQCALSVMGVMKQRHFLIEFPLLGVSSFHLCKQVV